MQVGGAGSRSSYQEPRRCVPWARATARWRRRKARGSFVVPVELFDHEVEALIDMGSSSAPTPVPAVVSAARSPIWSSRSHEAGCIGDGSRARGSTPGR